MRAVKASGGPAVEGAFGFEDWRGQIQKICGHFNPELGEPRTFTGWARTRERAGFEILDVACNVERIERGWKDTRRDDTEFFYMILQLQGGSIMMQNDSAVKLASGDIILIDSTKPSSFRYDGMYSHQLSVHLPRRESISYLGFQPEGGVKACRDAGLARMLFTFFASEEAAAPAAVSPFHNLLVYDLLGAGFPASPIAGARQSLHTGILYNRVCALILRRSHDPDLAIATVAEAAGISIRYVQKLFTDHGTSFTEILETTRLERASTLLCRRQLLGGRTPICDIATACGFASIPHFSRTFRNRYGHPPRDHGKN